MRRIASGAFIAPLPIAIGAALLIFISSGVILSWHFPQFFPSLYPYATLMAYNTAVSFLLCGLALVTLINQLRQIGIILTLGLLILSAIRITEMLFDLPLNSDHWYKMLLSAPITVSMPTSSITFITFIFTAITLLLLFSRPLTPRKILITAFIALIIATIACSIMIGHSLHLFPSSVWTGRKMSPHTALCFFSYAAAIITSLYPHILNAFTRLNFFNRLTIGFMFMSILFIGIGSIGILQINSVAAISQKLYQEPLQANNAALRIKNYIGLLNRTIKNIAINPELAKLHQYRPVLEQTIINTERDIDKFTHSEEYTPDLQRLRHHFSNWTLLVDTLFQQLEQGNFEQYQRNALNENQRNIVILEQICDSIIERTQAEMAELNNEAIRSQHHAENLMLIIISGFLIVGVFVSALLTRSLNEQLNKVRAAMLNIAQGQGDTLIPFLDYPHEIGDMARTLEVFAQNVNERKKNANLLIEHQKELERTNQQLASTNKELETFAYVASHDLKSPLRGIAQLSTWIEEDLESKEFTEVNKHTTMLRNRILRMEKLLDDMLVFYRAGKTEGVLSHIDVAHMASELFDIQNTKPGLRLELAKNLPSFDTLKTPFEQTLRNLFSNAIKHHDTDEGVISLNARIIDENFYEFSVSDDGPGIPFKFQERVFGMFQTLKSRDELEGSGMGLALIKKIVETYGGTISVFSEGRGCCFTFTWPIHIKRKQSHD